MLISRSARESHLYMDLHPCDCGQAEFARDHHLIDRDGVMVSVYEGFCQSCDRLRSFEFGHPDELEPAVPAFGGPDPSTIIDPGEYLSVADQVGTDAGLRLLNSPPAEHNEQRAKFEYAIAALEEVLKFLPAGLEEIPAEAFTSPRGREIYRKDPTRFTRFWLNDDLARKRRILAGIDRFSRPSESGPVTWNTPPPPTPAN
ncbi:hypothetical protein ACI2LF_09635 [Kribbella sp. NPDC020789]